MKVGNSDIYGGASKHFEAHHLARPPLRLRVGLAQGARQTAVAGLDALIEKARGARPASTRRCVARRALDGRSRDPRTTSRTPRGAEKVERIVTVGTPYWGSPKPIFPLAAGIEVP